MYELGYRTKRRERRLRVIALGAGLLGLFMSGAGVGWVLHVPTDVPVAGASPVPCITLAVFPNEFVPKEFKVHVNVLNGSTRVGMANINAELLKLRGFKIENVDNFEGAIVKSPAEVRYGPSGKDAALRLASYVFGAKLVADSRATSDVDLIIGQKFEQLLNKAQADAELARPIASPSGPGC